MTGRYFTTCHGDIVCSKTCHAVCVFESYLARLEENREKDEPLNKQAYDDAREMSAVVSLYKHGSKEAARNAAKTINKYYGL